MKALWLPVLIPAALLTWPLLLYPGRPRSIAPFDRLPIAHRGLHTGTAEAPENTLPAFRRARQAGVAVELDIRLTADRQVVVVHDNELTRLCGTRARVSALSYAQLCRLPVLGSTAHIPLLRDVLAALGDTPVVCELKQGGRALYTAAWPLLAAYPGALCIESFDPRTLYWFRRHHPQVRRGLLAMHPCLRRGQPLSMLLTNLLTRPDFIAYRFRDRPELSVRLCRWLYHPPMLAWTLRTQQEQLAAEAQGFTGCIFEGYRPTEPFHHR